MPHKMVTGVHSNKWWKIKQV